MYLIIFEDIYIPLSFFQYTIVQAACATRQKTEIFMKQLLKYKR